MSYFLEQLQAAAAASASKPARRHFNPNPPGQPKPGGTTEAVIGELRRTGAALTEAQLIWRLKSTHSAISWALLRLVGWGMVVKIPDPNRHARYCRYRAVTGDNDER